MKKPRFLVIMATFNGRDFVVEQLQSILAQRGVDVRIEVWDDFSDDGTLEILSEFSASNKCIRVRRHASRCGGAAANFLKALNQTAIDQYDFVAFSDQDDIWLEHKLERSALMLRAEGGDGYSSSTRAFWPDGREVELKIDKNMRALDHIFGGAGQGCTFTMTRGLAMEFQRFVRDSSAAQGFHYHDWLCYLFARVKGKKWIFDERVSLLYRQHNSNDTGSRRSFAGVVKRFFWIKNGWYAKLIRESVDVALELNASDHEVRALKRLLNDKASIRSRFALVCLVAGEGRRGNADRGVLAIVALLGWLFAQ